MNRQNLSRMGEEKAKQYLQSKGYTILEKNFKTNCGEIDIIAIDNNNEKTLVFIEVKTRISEKYGKPEDAITKRKLKTIKKTGEYYSLLHDSLPKLLRIDAVLIEVNNNKITRLELIKNAEV